MAYLAEEYLITASAVSIATAMGITDISKRHPQSLMLRNNSAAAQDAFFGGSNVTTTTHRGGQLKASDTYPTYVDGPIDLAQIFLIGTAGATNIIFISIVY